MRPVRLRAEGFAAFRELVDVDFEGVDFFALVGPTGAGKSSVIDAICFALYGVVPRYDDARMVGRAVSVGAHDARVEFTFDAAGSRYVIVRVVRVRDEKASTRDARLERVLADGSTESLAGNVKDLNECAPAIVGLSYEQFTRCVMLPQGEFARFLHDRRAERNALLVRLLDLRIYSQIRALAHTRRTAATTAAKLAEQELSALPDASEATIASARARVVALDGLAGDLEAARPAAEERKVEASAVRSEVERTRRLLLELGAVKVPKAVEALAGTVDAAAESLEHAERELQLHVDRCEQLAAQIHEHGDISVLRVALAAHDQAQRSDADVAAAESALATASAPLAGARAALDAADQQRAAAMAELTALQQMHAPHALAAQLEIGEPCPVCEQVVLALPEGRDASMLDDAQRRANAADQVAAEQRQRLAAIEQARTNAQAVLEVQIEARERIAAQVAAHPAREALESAINVIDELVKQRTEAETLRTQSDAACRAARAVLEAERTKLQKLTKDFNTQREKLVREGLELPPSGGSDLVAEWTALASFANEALPAVEKQHLQCGQRLDELDREQREIMAAFTVRGVALQLEAADALHALATAVSAASANATRDVEQLEGVRTRAAQLSATVAEQRACASVAHELHRLLDAKNFEPWLLQEALAVLVAGASEILLRLSEGAYSLTHNDNEFQVIDHHNADEVRSVRTLSGGETFQASLAFAMALAEHVAALSVGGGAPLESLFLDEGFGTLDAATLDVVASTIEALASEERMVGIVTHVRELAERVPVRFEVRKVGRTAVVERVDA